MVAFESENSYLINDFNFLSNIDEIALFLPVVLKFAKETLRCYVQNSQGQDTMFSVSIKTLQCKNKKARPWYDILWEEYTEKSS